MRGDRSYEVLLSMGMVCYDPECPCTIDEVLMRADDLMYEDKRHYHRLIQKAEPLLKTRVERREYKRFDIVDNCWVEIDSFGKVRIKDLSIGGICLKTTQYLHTKSTCKIRVFTPGNEVLTASGLVVWSAVRGKDAAEDNLYQYESGLKFIGMIDSQKNSIEKFVTKLSG